MSGIKLRPVLGGILSWIPGIAGPLSKGTGGTDSARYCYSVWLRHLVMAQRNGLCPIAPGTVAELGPGDSIGTGLMALLTGTRKYYALDVVRHDSLQKTRRILGELLELCKRRENIPGEDEFPRLRPLLDSYEFPSDILTAEVLKRTLSSEQIERVEQSIANVTDPSSMVSYANPFPAPSTIPSQSVNMVFSQGVLGCVEHLAETYQLMNEWLQPGGILSHRINLSCHIVGTEWDWHWTCSDLAWKLIRGRRIYYINREPHSIHIRLIQQAGFRIVSDIRSKAEASNRRLAPRFSHFSAEDRTTSGAFIQAVKPGS